MGLNNIQYKTMSDLVVEQLIDQILNEELRVGDVLPTEEKLQTTMGVGRSTVREALKSLEIMGMIKRSKSGTVITQPDNEIMSKIMQCYLLLSEIDIEKLANLRLTLEPSIIRLAVLLETDEDIAKLEQILKESENDNNPTNSISFHNYIAEMTGNELYILIMQMIRPIFMDLQKISLKSSMGISGSYIVDHQDILKAMKEKDEDKASELMYKHLHQLCETLALNREMTSTVDTQEIK